MNAPRRFKLFLEPTALRDGETIDPRLPKLPPGKRAIDLIIDFLGYMWEVSIVHSNFHALDLMRSAPVRKTADYSRNWCCRRSKYIPLLLEM